MTRTLLILVACAAVSCQTHPSGHGEAPPEPVPMGTGRTETKVPERP
jgi:hypothetical protein